MMTACGFPEESLTKTMFLSLMSQCATFASCSAASASASCRATSSFSALVKEEYSTAPPTKTLTVTNLFDSSSQK